MSTIVAPALWEVVRNDFKTLFSEDVYRLWIEPVVCLDVTETSITLGAPNDYASYWVQDNYCDLIVQRLLLNTGRNYAVTVKVAPSAQPATAATAAPAAANTDASAEPGQHNRAAAMPRRAVRIVDERPSANGTLNPRNTFQTYVKGANNEVAHAAAMAVAAAPAQTYNPLFIYGATGLGKTHLMHAIGHAVLGSSPHSKVVYISTEKFTNDYVQALQENALTKFRQRYRQVDVLIIDDIHFLGGKERIQEEFFHTFNTLFESRKQIVISSDRRASEIDKLEERLVSRFEWGLTVDIQAPDYETRLAILRNKAAQLKCNLPHEVLNFIAQHVAKNIRRLEGALLRVASYASLKNIQIDLPTTELLLKEILMEQAQSQLTIETIQKLVAEHRGIRLADMTSKRRPANIAFPRQIAMYLARTLTKHSLQEIGEAFGGRDHGTVIHACKTVENMMEQDSSARNTVEFLRTQLARA